ncbi:MAG: HEAT repeat domain-containing protein [Candidatus Zixiibacteriota bacterium]
MKMKIYILSAILIVCFALPLKAELMQETVDSMFVIASSGAMKYRDMVQPTIEDMAAYEAEIVPFLIEKLNTTDARERMTLEQIFRKIKEPAVPLLNETLINDPDSMRLSRVALMLFYIPDTSSVTNLLTVVNHSYYWLRYEAVRALGKIGDTRGKDAVVNALKDENELVRTIAAVSCGRMIHDKELFKILVPMFDDPYYGVRFSSMESLKDLDCEIKQDNIFDALKKAKSDFQKSYLSLLMAEDSCLYDIKKVEKSFDLMRFGDAVKTLWKSDCAEAIRYGTFSYKQIDSPDLAETRQRELNRLISEMPPCEKATPADSR